MARTHRWAERCRRAQTPPRPGALRHRPGERLRRPPRRERARAWRRLDFPGYAIGGVSVGETQGRLLAHRRPRRAALLPAERPRYLMGVGSPEDLVEGVAAGVDLFDCVLPTRLARNGTILTAARRVSLDSRRAGGRRTARSIRRVTATPAPTSRPPTSTICSRPRSCSPIAWPRSTTCASWPASRPGCARPSSTAASAPGSGTSSPATAWPTRRSARSSAESAPGAWPASHSGRQRSDAA